MFFLKPLEIAHVASSPIAHCEISNVRNARFDANASPSALPPISPMAFQDMQSSFSVEFSRVPFAIETHPRELIAFKDTSSTLSVRFVMSASPIFLAPRLPNAFLDSSRISTVHLGDINASAIVFASVLLILQPFNFKTFNRSRSWYKTDSSRETAADDFEWQEF